MGSYRVIVSDQVFPSVEVERRLLAEIGASLEVANGTVEDLRNKAADADAVLNTYLPIDAATIAALPRCRIIARYGIGVDNVDVAAAAAAGITVTNVPDYSIQEVAAHALALILSLLRKVPQADAKIRGGGWGLDGLRPIRRVSELTFGLVGYGRIARQLARSIEALGGPIVVHDPYVAAGPGIPPLLSLDELLERSDVISVHAPLTPDTRGLIDAAAIARMRPGAVLVNTSRGPLVVLEAVTEALREGRLAGAGLDVFDREPLDPTRVDGVPNLIVTPHIGYYSEESIAESQRKAATQVIKVLTGVRPDYPVRA
jgi:D-3-phosphoglycerate dehydrogenase